MFLAQCADAKFAHIDEGEREKVAKECTEAKAWLSDKMSQQAALPKSAPLAVLTKEIAARTATVERFCKPIMSKPRPAPPAEEVSVVSWYPRPSAAKAPTAPPRTTVVAHHRAIAFTRTPKCAGAPSAPTKPQSVPALACGGLPHCNSKRSNDGG